MKLRRKKREGPGREEGNGQNGPKGREHGRERGRNDEKTVRSRSERKNGKEKEEMGEGGRV